MTPEEVKKEQEASNIKPIQPIQQVNTEPAQLGKSQPIINTPPAESDKEYSGKVKDYKTVVSEAKSKGIDYDFQEGIPLLDNDKRELLEKMQPYAKSLSVQNLSDRISAYTQPELKKVPELDIKRAMDQERKIRRARWADALYAFGEGLQGRTANPETFATTRLQRQKDQEFKNYLDVTEQNRKARNAWNAQTTDETLKWLDEQAKNERLDNLTREKMRQLADQFKQQQDQAKKIADDLNATTLKVAGIRASNDKDNKPVVIKTAKNTYQLKPEEAAFMKGEVMKNSEDYRDKYPGWFEEVKESDEFDGKGNIIKGRTYFKLNPRITDTELIRAYIEANKEGFPQFEKSRENILKQQESRGEVNRENLNTPAKTPKADPLGLGL